MNFLDFIPGGRMVQLAVMAALVAAFVGSITWGVHSYNESLRDDGRAEKQAKCDASTKKQQADAIAEAAVNAQETKRRLERQGDAQREHDQELAAARTDAASATDAADRLRQRANKLAASACRTGGNPATGIDSATASPAPGMLADVLGKVGERSRLLADYAGAARRAGLQCERDYDALRDSPRSFPGH